MTSGDSNGRSASFSRHAAGRAAQAAPTRPADVFALEDRPWQADAYGRLRGKLRVRLKAPTASGKTLVMKALSADWRAQDRKCILAVPQEIIGWSHTRVPQGHSAIQILLPDGRSVGWSPDEVLLDVPHTVDKLIAFLRVKGSGILLCTHATLVAAAKRLSEDDLGMKLWERVALFIDEGHHTLIDPKSVNHLGRLLHWWADHNHEGPLTMVSATWMRSDMGAMLPDVAFDCFEYRIEDYLDHLRHLRTIDVVLRSATPRDAIQQALRDGARRLIVYLPMVRSRHAGGKSKPDLLAEALSALGPFRTDGAYRVHSTVVDGKKRTLRSIDLVTVEGRSLRKRTLLASVGTPDEPDVVFCLRMGIEGYDQPSLDRAVVLGPRDSMNVMAQILGRLLRDHHGKTGVQLDLVTNPDLTNTRECYERFVETLVVAILLDWCLSPPRLNDDRPLSEKELQAVAAGLMKNPAALRQDPSGLVRSLMGKILGMDNEDEALHKLGAKLALRYDQMLADSIEGIDPKLDFSGLRGIVESTFVQLTGRDFRQTRRALSKGMDFSDAEIARFVGAFLDEHSSVPTVLTEGGVSPKHPGVTWVDLDRYCRLQAGKSLRETVASVVAARRRATASRRSTSAA
jgi:hypothetical protein